MWDTLLQNPFLVIVVVLAVIICGAELIKAIGVWKKHGKDKYDKDNALNTKLEKIFERLDSIEESIDSLHEKSDKQDLRMELFETQLGDLTTSDMHDIKSWIVEQYHRFYTNQGWIDAFNAETIDRRYEDYKKEGGNSYIDTLIERLHKLPMDPPTKKD